MLIEVFREEIITCPKYLLEKLCYSTYLDPMFYINSRRIKSNDYWSIFIHFSLYLR